jgi:hypothetical protein
MLPEGGRGILICLRKPALRACSCICKKSSFYVSDPEFRTARQVLL